MNPPLRTIIYIDSANLHRASRELGFDIDYKRFYNWLHQKYKFVEAYIFIGFIEKNIARYEYLEACKFKLIFKETVTIGKTIKGNCDTDLAQQLISDFYTRAYDKCIIISGDGDFACLVHFLRKQNLPVHVLAPHSARCSFLLRRADPSMAFLNEHYHKFSSADEKAPSTDTSVKESLT